MGKPGAFGAVYKGALHVSGALRPEPVAVKVLLRTDFMSTRAIEDTLTREVAVGFRGRHHPNLVCTYGCAVKPDFGLCIAMEVVTGGTLEDALKEDPFPSLESRLGWLIDVANGMAALHSMRPVILHNDLKSPNVLLTVSMSVC